MGNSQAKNFDPNDEVSLLHFNMLRCVGKGAFGKVRMVEHKENKIVYALKYINKRDCIKMEALRNIFRERNILERVDHPYICNLRFAFQDDSYMYMAMDLMLGGDLRFHLERGSFNEATIKVWVAELSAAIGYLHSKRIVHRDIKPDNILLDELGHVHLTDFNIATQFDPSRPLVSESGTCVYMAPEMFGGRGYIQHVDWWALGVVMYECIYGKRPFDGDSSEKVKKQIRHDIIAFPVKIKAGGMVTGPCVQVLRGLLERDREKRLGCGEDGWLGMRELPWFDGLEWSKVEIKEFPPVFVPDEMLMDETPLEAKPRRKHSFKGKYAKELEVIERKFKKFDYLQYESYDPIVDPVKMTVSEPPNWVKCVDGNQLPPSRIVPGNGSGPYGEDGGEKNPLQDLSPAPLSADKRRGSLQRLFFRRPSATTPPASQAVNMSSPPLADISNDIPNFSPNSTDKTMWTKHTTFQDGEEKSAVRLGDWDNVPASHSQTQEGWI